MSDSINEAINDVKEEENQEITKKNKKIKAEPVEVRDTFLEEALKDHGIDPTGMTNDEMTKALIRKSNQDRDKLIQKEVTKEEQMIKGYTEGNDVTLTDPDFIYRLRMMNVPRHYLHLFRDHDKTIKDHQIWKRIRHSGVKPFSESISSILSRKK